MAGFSNPVKSRVLESYSNIVFVLTLLYAFASQQLVFRHYNAPNFERFCLKNLELSLYLLEKELVLGFKVKARGQTSYSRTPQ